MKRRNKFGYVVEIDDNAFIDMCLSGLEAYAVRHDDYQANPCLETFCQLWGKSVQDDDLKTRFVIEKAHVDTSADRYEGMCVPKNDAFAIKKDFMTSFFPNFEFLGDFHTHPYPNVTPDFVHMNRLYGFSDTDVTAIEGHVDHWKRHNYRVGLVMTICTFAQFDLNSVQPAAWQGDSWILFNANNYYIWFKAYVAYKFRGMIKLSDLSVDLVVPCLSRMLTPNTTFGHANPWTCAHVPGRHY